MWFGVCRISGSEYRGLRAWGSGLRVSGLGFTGFRV